MSTRTLFIPLGGGGPSPSDFYTKEQVDALIADFITNTVNDLVYYYSKSETYTKAEVQQLVGQITSFEVVATLPVSNIKTNVIYLLGPIGTGADKYEEYIYSNSTWVKIGETSIDLSNYITVNQLNTALGFYTPTQQLATVATTGAYSDLSGTPTIPDDLNDLTDVTVSNPSNGQVLKYNSTSQKWENGTGGGGGGNVVELTQQQYDALVTPDPDTTYIITDADAIDMDDYATQSDMETVQTALAGKADKQSVTANTGLAFPHWNEQGVITGADSHSVYQKTYTINDFSGQRVYGTDTNGISIWAPTTKGTQGYILQSNGNSSGQASAPTWVDFYSTYTGGLKFWMGTQAQYDALAPNYDSSTLYVIQD